MQLKQTTRFECEFSLRRKNERRLHEMGVEFPHSGERQVPSIQMQTTDSVTDSNCLSTQPEDMCSAEML